VIARRSAALENCPRETTVGLGWAGLSCSDDDVGTGDAVYIYIYIYIYVSSFTYCVLSGDACMHESGGKKYIYD